MRTIVAVVFAVILFPLTVAAQEAVVMTGDVGNVLAVENDFNGVVLRGGMITLNQDDASGFTFSVARRLSSRSATLDAGLTVDHVSDVDVTDLRVQVTFGLRLADKARALMEFSQSTGFGDVSSNHNDEGMRVMVGARLGF